jgi:2-polyprenyl-3-methyl-5-hydroxy-6-metoxy-1,4-benzoquinol methylase
MRASVFFGERLLDVGGGYVPGPILDALAERGVRYDCVDIDERVTAHMSQELKDRGMHGTAMTGEVGSAALKAGSYDAIFASHSVEHSSSIPHTLDQLLAALKPEGVLIMAVPIGWDDSEEHVNCYSADEWTMIVQGAGFDILSLEIGKLYDPSRHDLTVVAQRPSA